MRSLFFTLAQLAPVISAISLWNTTGIYQVGYTQHVLNHTTTPDDPTPNPGILLLTIYYPTMQVPAGPVPYLDAKTARAYEQALGVPNGTLSLLTTNLQFQAPTLLGTHPAFGNGTSPYPTILFTPGAGGTISGYQAYLSEFASHGYAVVGIDHPGEAPYTALPHGASGVDGIRDISSLTSVDIHHMYEYRLADLAAVLNPSSGGGLLPALIAQHGAPFNTTHYAVLGHSMGGAASAGAIIAAPGLYRAGSNLDGTFQHLVKPDPTGNATAVQVPDPDAPNPDLRTPFVELASEARFMGVEDADASWARFNKNQTGWLRDVQVNGTAHLDYMDTPLGFDLLGAREGGVVPPAALGALGTIAGKRVTEVVTGLLLSFFGEFVGGGAGVESVDAFIARTPEAFVMAEK